MLAKAEQQESYLTSIPLFLKITCIAGFVFIGLTIIMGLLLIIVAGAPSAFRMFPEINFYVSVIGGKITMSFALTSLILPMISFYGIIQMWNQIRTGLWLFVAPIIIMTALPFLMIDLPVADIMLFAKPMIIISLVFIILFGLNYKNLH